MITLSFSARLSPAQTDVIGPGLKGPAAAIRGAISDRGWVIILVDGFEMCNGGYIKDTTQQHSYSLSVMMAGDSNSMELSGVQVRRKTTNCVQSRTRPTTSYIENVKKQNT